MKGILVSLTITVLLFHASGAAALDTIVVAATHRSIANYNRFVNTANPADIDHFESATRQVVDLILVQKALRFAGMPDVGITFVQVPNSARERETVRKGIAVIGENDHWASAFSDAVYMTEAIIPEGAFEKGIYTSPGKLALLKATSLEEIQGYRAVMIKTWAVDWMTLNAMAPVSLTSAPRAENLFLMIAAGRADFTLFEFSSEKDFSRTIAGIRLIPVPGIKVGLKGSRHLMVSKRHRDGKTVYDALQTGIPKLKQAGIIQRALIECGFYDPRVKNWKKIN